jgi:hypothetical protein
LRTSVLCAGRNMGEPRVAARSLRRNNRPAGSLPHQTARPPKTEISTIEIRKTE